MWTRDVVRVWSEKALRVASLAGEEIRAATIAARAD